MDKNFWKTKPLSDFTEEEWEAVCMRCGKCCLYKTEKCGKILFSNKMCESFDFKTGGCSHYATRLGPECSKVDMRLLTEEPELLPETCAYRLLLAGKELPDYHPLVSGNPHSAHIAKQTVMERPDIYSVTEINNLLSECNKAIKDKNCTLKRRRELFDRLGNMLESTYVAEYDIPIKP